MLAFARHRQLLPTDVSGCSQLAAAWKWVVDMSVFQHCLECVMLVTLAWYAVAVWYDAGLASARARVRIPPVAAVYQRQLGVPSLRGRLMSSSLWAMGWRPSVADWVGGMSVVLRHGSTCPPSRALDGCIPRRGTTSLYQSAATSRL